jgi:hypothetical protein
VVYLAFERNLVLMQWEQVSKNTAAQLIIEDLVNAERNRSTGPVRALDVQSNYLGASMMTVVGMRYQGGRSPDC